MTASGVFIGSIAASVTHVTVTILPAQLSKLSKYTVLLQQVETVSKLSKLVVLRS